MLRELTESPKVSIVIPVYNEEAILHAAVVDLIDLLQAMDWSYEIILAENGSSDGTVAAAEALAKRFDNVRMLQTGEPNYGKALRKGILDAKSEYVICDEIDLCDTDFHGRALEILERGDADLIVGSKVMKGANDERPFFRHLGTLVINRMLRLTLGFQGSDTHGLKAFRREPLVPIAEQCIVDKDLFASEFVIRAERARIPIKEIPVRVLEKRPPSVGLVRRVPNVLRNLLRLIVAIRFKP